MRSVGPADAGHLVVQGVALVDVLVADQTVATMTVDVEWSSAHLPWSLFTDSAAVTGIHLHAILTSSWVFTELRDTTA